jgi:DNA-binding PadR family transcriptional regulator
MRDRQSIAEERTVIPIIYDHENKTVGNSLKEMKESIVKGLLPYIVISHAKKHGEFHGYALIAAIRKSYDIYFGPSTIYPALNSCEKKGILKSEWRNERRKLPRKVYTLTNEGESVLAYPRGKGLKKEMRRGAVKGLLPLIILSRAKRGELHGYELMTAIRDLYHVKIGASTIYPALNSCEKKGILKSEWKIGEREEVPRKVYTLTNEGAYILGSLENSIDTFPINIPILDIIMTGEHRKI